MNTSKMLSLVSLFVLASIPSTGMNIDDLTDMNIPERSELFYHSPEMIDYYWSEEYKRSLQMRPMNNDGEERDESEKNLATIERALKFAKDF